MFNSTWKIWLEQEKDDLMLQWYKVSYSVFTVCVVIVDPLLGKEREPRLTLLARAKVKWSVWHSIPVKHWMNEWTHRWVKLFDLADSTQLFPFVFLWILIWLFRGDWFDCRLEFLLLLLSPLSHLVCYFSSLLRMPDNTSQCVFTLLFAVNPS